MLLQKTAKSTHNPLLKRKETENILKTGKTPEKAEYDRLKVQFSALPPKKAAVADGLMWQAARLRVYLDKLWDDLMQNGTTEMFTQSEKTDPYERERPAARLFVSADKNYQSVMKQLHEMLPAEAPESDALTDLLNECG